MGSPFRTLKKPPEGGCGDSSRLFFTRSCPALGRASTSNREGFVGVSWMAGPSPATNDVWYQVAGAAQPAAAADAVAAGTMPVAYQARRSTAVPTQIERSTGVAMPAMRP